MSPSPGEYDRVLSLVERVREPAVALLLLNMALFIDAVVASTRDVSLPLVPTPWGNASFILGTIIVLTSFAAFYWGIGVIQRPIVVWLAPWLYRRTDDEDLPPEIERDMVPIWDLDTYLNIQYDDALKRAYDKQKRIIENIKLIRENSAVTLVLLLVMTRGNYPLKEGK